MNQPIDERSLLQEYARQRSPEVFRRLVERYVGVVYESARRQVRDAHLAEDVTQAVFILLSQKAHRIPSDRPLSGWLLTTTSYVAANARRDLLRRRNREQKAASMSRTIEYVGENVDGTGAGEKWEEISSLLDEGIAKLRGPDRDALLLRFFENKTHRAVGEAMGISEDAAEKRVYRAVERLREFLQRRGVTIASATLATGLAERVSRGAPPGLAANIASGAQGGATAGAALAEGAAMVMKVALMKLGICAAAAVLIAGVSVRAIRAFMSQPQLQGISRSVDARGGIVPAGVPVAMDNGAAPAVTMVTIGGIVADGQGQPINDVHVGLEWELPPSQQKLPGTTVKLGQAVTDPTGHWSYGNVPRQTLASVHVHLVHSEFASMTLSAPPDQLAGQTAAMTMDVGVDLRGQVVDTGGKPISGAKISTTSDWGYTNPGTPTATTDGEGHFTLRHVPGNTSVTLIARSDRFAPTSQDVTTSAPVAPVQIALSAGRTVRGLVADDSGQPVAGARVSVYGWSGGFSAGVQATTNSSGAYELQHAPDGDLRLSVYMSGYAGGTYDCADGQVELDFTVHSIPSFHGTVVDAQTKEPIPEFKVLYAAAYDQRGPGVRFPAWSATTFHDGQYEVQTDKFVGAIKGWYLRVEAHGYVPENSPLLTGSVMQDFALRPGADVVGRVFAPNGKPAAGVVVEMAVPDEDATVFNGAFRNDSAPQCVSDDDGNFNFPAQAEPFIVAAASDDGFVQAGSAALAKNADMHMVAWGRINGRLFMGGKPAANESVAAMLAEERHPVNFDFHAPVVRVAMTATTDADGRFTIYPVVPGNLVVMRNVASSQNTMDTAVTVAPGATAQVDLGVGCRNVTGRVILPKELTTGIQNWRLNVYAEEPSKVPLPASMPDAAKNSPAAWQSWMNAFLLTDAGKAYDLAVQRDRLTRPHYEIKPDPEGKFTCQDVQPGSYYLVALLTAYDHGSKIIGTGRANFTVSAPSAGNDGPVAIPDVTVEPGAGTP